MTTRKIDFYNEECSACRKKHVDIRTEIVAPSPDQPETIRKKIIFRCSDHLACDVKEMEKLAALKIKAEKALLTNHSDLEITTCKSHHDPAIGEHVGIQIRHKPSDILVKSVDETTQYANKLAAIELLQLELVKKRLQDLDDNYLVDG